MCVRARVLCARDFALAFEILCLRARVCRARPRVETIGGRVSVCARVRQGIRVYGMDT